MERVGVRVERMLVTAATAGPLSTASALRVSACMPRGLAACVGGWAGGVHARGVCSSSSDDAGATMSSGAQEAVPSTTSGDVALFSWGRGERCVTIRRRLHNNAYPGLSRCEPHRPMPPLQPAKP